MVLEKQMLGVIDFEKVEEGSEIPAAKVCTLLDHDGHIPAFATVTDAKTHESRIVQVMELPKGSIVVFDKGFISYPWFRILGAKGVFFVTRLKRNAVFKLLERRLVNRKTGVTSDHIIEVSM